METLKREIAAFVKNAEGQNTGKQIEEALDKSRGILALDEVQASPRLYQPVHNIQAMLKARTSGR